MIWNSNKEKNSFYLLLPIEWINLFGRTLHRLYILFIGFNYKKEDIQCKGNVWFQKLSIPPPQKGFFLRPPPPPTTSLWKFQSSFIHLLKFLGLWEPPTPQEFPIPSVGEYGYFLELHYEEHTEEVVYWYHLAEILLSGSSLRFQVAG